MSHTYIVQKALRMYLAMCLEVMLSQGEGARSRTEARRDGES